jgi:hypothetical protein
MASGSRFYGRIAQFAARRQHIVNHGSQRGVNHAASYGRLTHNFKRIWTRFCHE